MPNILTGIGGSGTFKTSSIADMRNWRVTESGNIKEYVSSDTAGFVKTALGAKRAEGQFEVFLNSPSISGIAIGDTGALALTATEGGTPWSADSVRISDIEYGVDIEGADFPGATVSFIADGDFQS